MDERDALNINGRLAARWARRTVERLRREAHGGEHVLDAERRAERQPVDARDRNAL